MRFARFLIPPFLLCALGAGFYFQRAQAQIGGTLGGPALAPPTWVASPNAASAPTVAPIVAPKPAAAPALPPPIPQRERVRVGLSTAGAPISIYAPKGLLLTDAAQPGRALRVGAGETAQFSLVPAAAVAIAGRSYRGTLGLRVAGRTSRGWQRVAVAVLGKEPARVTSNGKSARWGRPYRGGFEIFPQQLANPQRQGPLALVNVVAMEDYLKGVVPWEMDASAPFEALKAQAICARTKTLDFRRSKRFGKGDFDICDYDACQGYPGTENEKPASSSAVETTKGLAIFKGGKPIDAVFCTNSGGITANAGDVWTTSGNVSYLQSVRDFSADSPLVKIVKPRMTEADWMLYCSQSWPSYARPSDAQRAQLAARRAKSARTAALYGPDDEPEFYRWQRFVSIENAQAAFAARGFARVSGFEIVERSPSGHISQLKVSGEAKPTPGASLTPAKELAPISITLQGDGAIRAMFSGRLGSTTALPSSTFVISPVADAAGQLTAWQINGAGWGHGVGMCQRGAQNHALSGWDARRILAWYYRDVEVKKLY